MCLYKVIGRGAHALYVVVVCGQDAQCTSGCRYVDVGMWVRERRPIQNVRSGPLYRGRDTRDIGVGCVSVWYGA